MSFLLGAFIGAAIGFFLAAVLSAAGEETMTMHGSWQDNHNGTYICSVCGCKASKTNYCGNCGAKMDLK